MSTHHDADAQKLKHCLGRLLAAGEVDGTTDPSAAVQTLIRAHPEYGRRPVGPLRAAVREALAVAEVLEADDALGRLGAGAHGGINSVA